MRNISALLIVLLIASCDSHEEPTISRSVQVSRPKAPSPPPAPPPLPPLPGSTFKPIPEDQALEIAMRMGPGDCSDLNRIQGLPMTEQFGFDPYYDRIMVHIDSYESCLFEATASTEETRVVASYPGIQIKTVGDIAFVLLGDGKKVSWNECTPAEIIEQEKQMGSLAFYAWLNKPGSRKQWHNCLVRKHGT